MSDHSLVSLNIIQLMEERGLTITPKIASKALKSALLSVSESDAEVLKYLMKKGGKLDFEFTPNFWKWEKLQNSMQAVIQHTTVTPKFLSKARALGVLNEHECMRLEKMGKSIRSKRFYEIVQEKPSSFERVLLILIDNQQMNVLDLLKHYLKDAHDKLRSSMFVTPPPRFEELLFSDTKQSQVMVLATSSTEFSVRRIRDTVDKNIAVIEEQDVVNMQIQDKLVVLKCEHVTDELISKLMRFKSKFICICSSVGRGIDGCEILIDDYTWDDISSFYIDKLWFRIRGNMYNVAELFASPDIIGKLDKLEGYQYYKYRIVELKLGHATGCNKMAPFSKKSLDYLILKQTRQFAGIPNLTSEINVNELLPRARRVLGIQDQINLFELSRLLQHVQCQSTEIDKTTEYQFETLKLESNPYDNQIATKCSELMKYLKCQNHDMTLMKLAVSTLFPHIDSNTNTDELDEYVNIGLLELMGNSLVFRNEVLAWYFIAELLAEPENVDFITLNLLTNEIFINCFEAHTYHVPDCYLSIPSFRFTNKTVFKFVDSIAIKHTDIVSNLLAKYLKPETASKFIHACVNDNLFNLLKIVVGRELQGKLFESLNLVVLAVAYADVDLIEWETQQYENRNNQLVAHIQLELMYPADKHSKYISILHVAVERGDPSVLEFLLDKHFKHPTIQPESLDICLPIYSGNSTSLHASLFCHGHKQVELIRLLINKGADVNARGSKGFTTLHFAVRQRPLPPRVMEIVRLLIEFGADPDAVDEDRETFLQCATRFFTPELYHQLIVYLDSTGRRSTITQIDSNNCSTLHHASLFLELLEITLDIFKQNGIDFNGVDKDGNSVLFDAIAEGRSPSFLNTLVSFGADWTITNNFESNLLHWAAEYGNLPALKLFISLGCEMNTSNLYGRTPLHKAVISKNINVEIINELINHGADVNAKNNNENCQAPDNRTPLHLALSNHSEKQLELIKLLINQGADVNARASEEITPLHYAVRQRPLPPRVMEIVHLLIENGADPDSVDKDGETFLHVAPEFFTPELYHELIVYFDSTGRKNTLKAVTSHNWSHLHSTVSNFDPLLATLKIFKASGIDFNGEDNDGDSVVFVAIEGGRNAEFLNILFTFGADWTITNKLQENALNFAARYENLSALKLFIMLGCDVNSPNINGHTAIHNAFLVEKRGEDIKTSHELVVELLNHGADVNAKDNNGNLPIDLANERLKNGFVEKITMRLLQASTLTN